MSSLILKPNFSSWKPFVARPARLPTIGAARSHNRVITPEDTIQTWGDSYYIKNLSVNRFTTYPLQSIFVQSTTDRYGSDVVSYARTVEGNVPGRVPPEGYFSSFYSSSDDWRDPPYHVEQSGLGGFRYSNDYYAPDFAISKGGVTTALTDSFFPNAVSGNTNGWFSAIDIANNGDFYFAIVPVYPELSEKPWGPYVGAPSGKLVYWKSDDSVSWGFRTYTAPPGEDYVAVVSSYDLGFLALKIDGSIVYLPSNTSASPDAFTDIVAGPSNFAGLRKDGSIWVEGSDSYGVVSQAPVEADFIQISLGTYHAIAQRRDGSVVVWGSDNPNALGEGNVVSSFPEGLIAKKPDSGHDWMYMEYISQPSGETRVGLLQRDLYEHLYG